MERRKHRLTNTVLHALKTEATASDGSSTPKTFVMRHNHNRPHITPSLISQAVTLAYVSLNSGHRLTFYSFPALHFVNGNACSSIANNVFYNTEMN